MTPDQISSAAEEIISSIDGQVDAVGSDPRGVKTRLRVLAVCVKGLADLVKKQSE